jgi:hypothetical protein
LCREWSFPPQLCLVPTAFPSLRVVQGFDDPPRTGQGGDPESSLAILGTVSFGGVSCSGSLRQLGGSLVATSKIGVKFERLGGEVAVGPAVSSFSDERAQIPSP